MAWNTSDFLPKPWAATGDKNTIPTSQVNAGEASWNDGFPQETSMPLQAGGYAPERKDFNGGMYAISKHTFFQQSGNLYPWNNGLDYDKGAHVLGSNGLEYIAVANNGVSSTVKNPVNDSNGTYWRSFLDMIYPVGSIYMSVLSTNPATFFGGTWQKIQGQFLLGAGGGYTLGTSGGNASVTLTTANMPSHNHTVTAANTGAHTHTLKAANVTAASAGGHTHTATNASNGAHTHTVSGSAASNGGHTHTRGTMDITGKTVNSPNDWQNGEQFTDADTFTNSGALWMGDSQTITKRYKQENITSQAIATSINFQASKGWTGETSTNGAHTHTTSGTAASNGNHTHTITVTTAGAHTHTVSGTSESAGNHTHTMTCGSKGSGTAVNILPPYLVVNIWQRTA